MRRLAALILTLIFSGMVCLPAVAGGSYVSDMVAQDYDGYGMVTSSTLNLRAEPSSKAQVIRRYPFGTWLRIIGGRPERDYYYVVAEDGRRGYVMTRYVAYCDNFALTNGLSTASPATVKGPAKYVYLRSAPYSSASALARINNGKRVYIERYGPVYSEVTVGQQRGYMSSGLLVMDGQTAWAEAVLTAPNMGSINLRGGPDLTAPVIDSYGPGTMVIILNRGRVWHRVFVGEQMGFIMASFVSERAK